jgi:3-oxoadipate enol-lactonase
VDDVVELMRVRQMTNVVVVGCSMGGMVAKGIAGKVLELLSGLVLAGTSHAQTPQSAQAMLKRSEDALEGMSCVVHQPLSDGCRRLSAAHSRRPSKRSRTGCSMLTRLSFYGDGVRLRGSTTWRARAKPRCRRCWCGGSLDASTAEERMRAMQALSSMYVEMPGAGHLAPMEQPEAFASVLRNFIIRQVAQW